MLVSELDLPTFDYTDPALRGESFHRVLGQLAERSWLVRSDLGYVVLEREAVMEFLRDRRLSFPSVQILELQGITEGPVHDRTKNGLMAQTGADHSRLRRLVSPAFTPKATERLKPRLRELLDELWADAAPEGRCDFVTAFAERLPSMVIAELLGLPGEEKRLLSGRSTCRASSRSTSALIVRPWSGPTSRSTATSARWSRSAGAVLTTRT